MSSKNARLATGGRIDRSITWRFTVDGQEFVGHPGDTIASALLANGHINAGNSLYEARPRGIMAAGVEEPNALVKIAPRFPGHVAESMLPATAVSLVDGQNIELLSGLGKLDPAEDKAEYDKKYVHTDVLVVGGGVAGLAAAREAVRTGARVILIDDQPELGGSLLSASTAEGLAEEIEGKPALEWIADVEAELVSAEECTVLHRTTAFGSYDSNYFIAAQNRTDHLTVPAAPGVSRTRIWHIRAEQAVLAPGAHERPLVFENNDRPGIMLASAVRTYLNRYAVAVGQRVVISTTNDSAYLLAADLKAAGIPVAAVVDARPQISEKAAAAVESGLRVLIGSAVADTSADEAGRLNGVTVRSINDDGELTSGVEQIAADVLAVSGGWSPVVHLHSQRQGKLRWDDDLAAFIPSSVVRDQQVVGAGRGSYELQDCLAEGISAGAAASIAAGFESATTPSELTAPTASAPTRQLWLVPGQTGEPGEWHNHFVDFQRDQSVADVLRSTGAGMRSVEHVKRYTSISTANDQGKTSGVNAIGVIAAALKHGGADAVPGIGEIGTTAYRAPFTPVAFAALAGRQRGELFDPARVTSIHPWHVAQGALFEDVGQWKRPWYYPQDGEDMDTAVLRECAAVRDSVGFMDATTLGKIEIRGKDAGEFLNRVYTNAFKKLAPGSARYGVMCTLDGMIFDDGVTLRLDEDTYFMTTTTSGAAKVLDWLEEWHQTEWPELDVVFTSVTEQWSTIAVVGPKSREVIAKVAPQLAENGGLEAENFPFMTFRETTLASGVQARVCRISFSGELAYEINVPSWYGLNTWEAVAAAGAEFNITPYGTETMHVLRAEKGYPIVGQDTDGTVTPQDAGMEWIVSKAKDFIGKRSYLRADSKREDRKHLVSVLPADHSLKLPEGTQLVEKGIAVNPAYGPVPMEGFVTSSYHSAALGRSFGLALIQNGRNRIGETLQASVGDQLVDVVVGETVLFDAEGTRKDG
ncbi:MULTISPECIES: 2Fe-2S iron-sulfur cluster-binding protein [Paenarthrobacter]|uniref:Sarcosine oxidase subunit alpha n=1 Tax=Paenarthrobacter ureafaciens TaxID=37931 RepID=A0AAX3EJM2_PAEUR|nr:MULTISPECIES: 2Fe-2S iron-sulfur cluster-binding protein [Paenarthrobacter]NKR13778.1 ferredoxin [Arthrobacter sp. M5]NKR17994.1 ferredoxin [Arthrobacter sp. M6]OEH59067.1 ferredoxin [Arthrobacter sp. D4]OEH59093.1 ferredoxin [Arthrobacter sp. D2]MDO5866481.1 2Fe-2S iron-sulfur cluster-binding protein [Paenarthrobacter sp. SD-2]